MKKCCFCNENENLSLGNYITNYYIHNCPEPIYHCNHCHASYIIADEFLNPAYRSDLTLNDYCQAGFEYFKKNIPLPNTLYVLINYKNEKIYEYTKNKFNDVLNSLIIYKDEKEYKKISIKEIILSNFQDIKFIKVEKSK